jgi:hypothetical protein
MPPIDIVSPLLVEEMLECESLKWSNIKNICINKKITDEWARDKDFFVNNPELLPIYLKVQQIYYSISEHDRRTAWSKTY